MTTTTKASKKTETKTAKTSSGQKCRHCGNFYFGDICGCAASKVEAGRPLPDFTGYATLVW